MNLPEKFFCTHYFGIRVKHVPSALQCHWLWFWILLLHRLFSQFTVAEFTVQLCIRLWYSTLPTHYLNGICNSERLFWDERIFKMHIKLLKVEQDREVPRSVSGGRLKAFDYTNSVGSSNRFCAIWHFNNNNWVNTDFYKRSFAKLEWRLTTDKKQAGAAEHQNSKDESTSCWRSTCGHTSVGLMKLEFPTPDEISKQWCDFVNFMKFLMLDPGTRRLYLSHYCRERAATDTVGSSMLKAARR